MGRRHHQRPLFLEDFSGRYAEEASRSRGKEAGGDKTRACTEVGTDRRRFDNR